MKKLSIFFALVAVLVSTTLGSASANLDAKAFTFPELGYGDTLLVGPYDTALMYFSLPPTWSLTEGGTISLTFTHLLGGGVVSNSLNNNASWIGGSLLVFYNGQLIDTILLDTIGQTTKVIAIPEHAYRIKPDDGRQDIRFFLDASSTCDYQDVQSSVLIQSLSSVNFSYDIVPPATDLKLFPRPMYQASSLVPNRVKLILPDDPTAAELQAALTISAGLGSLTNAGLDVELLQNQNLTEDTRRNEHLIFVGQASKFPSLAGVQLPIPVTQQNGIKHDVIQDTDGVVEIALSPWDASHVIMLATANTDEGVLKAAQALSTGILVPSGQKDLSIITSTSAPLRPDAVAEDITLSELGKDTFTLGGYNGNYFSFDFYVSADQVLGEGAYFDLIATYSDLMNAERTAFTVILNETTIGSTSFANAGGKILNERLEILPNILRRGRNTVTLYSDLVPADNCLAPELDATWVTISSESSLHLPLSTRKVTLGTKIDLQDYPSILLQGESLEDFAVIVPRGDLVAWNKASQITSALGAQTALSIARLSAAYADDVPDAILQDKNLLVIGQATSLPILSDLNNYLPAPFTEGSNEAEQPTLLVNYRLLPNVSVGYLQLLPSPWNLNNVVLAVMGNSSIGLPMAADALLDDRLAVQLIGNFSILYGDQVLSTDTRLGPTRDGLTAEMPAGTLSEENIAPLEDQVTEPMPEEMSVAGTPGWLAPLFGASTAFILLLVFFVLRRESATRFKKNKKES